MTYTDKSYQITKYAPKNLSAYIGSYTVFHFTETAPVMMNPEGFFEMIFQMDCEIQQASVESDNWKRRPSGFIGGLHNKSYLVKPTKPGSQLISVRFKPDSANHFIPDRLNMYKNRVVDLSDIFPHQNLAGLEPVFHAPDTSQNIKVLESFLEGLFREKHQSIIGKTVSAIYLQHGFVNVNDLAQQACLSNPQFRKRFNEEVGMSPKEYSKIVRINYIANLLMHKHEENLTQLTYRLGYFDQAHFIKDFKSVTGFSPKNYLQQPFKQ